MLKKKQKWTKEKYEAFSKEVDKVREEVFAKIGNDDIQHIKKVRLVSRLSEMAGRALIHFSLDPMTWSAGILALWLHKQIEAIEIGHFALHGAWDDLPGAEKLSSKTFKWDIPVEEESWKRGHNILHHQYTNIAGRDPDAHFGFLRTSEEISWSPRHLFQIVVPLMTAPFFSYFVNAHMTGLTDLGHGEGEKGYADALPNRKLKTIAGAGLRSARKIIPYVLYNYFFWPLLAGPFWWKVLIGNSLAEMMRDLYCWASIYPGHFGNDLEHHPQSFKAEGRGKWYKSQIESTHNYKVNRVLSLLCGAMDYQIEHHLFPKLPPNRLREIAARIEKICRRYGVPYRTAPWGKTLGKALAQIVRMSLPRIPTADRLFKNFPRLKGFRFLSLMARDPKRFYVHLLDAYVEGELEIHCPLAPITKALVRAGRKLRLIPLFYRLTNIYSTDKSRTSSHAQDIKHHYDLETPLAEGKIDVASFYRLWLDETMTYTMAYWPAGTKTLEEAQRKKLLLYQKLADIRSGQDVYEPGFGFGSFIPYVLSRGARWFGANLSSEQSRWVREHYPEVAIREQDFLTPWKEGRKVKTFDRIVSIGNLEHIQDLDHCFKVFHRMLKPDGKLFVHLITLCGENGIRAMADEWFGSRIFPNGQFYSHNSLMTAASPYFDVEHEQIFNGIHYAKTLREWSARFERNIEKIQALGAPPRFIRLWRLYLALGEAQFGEGLNQNSVFVFVPKKTDIIP